VANMREIRARIRSVKNTQQITKAMKMVSAAKLRRVQSGTDGMRRFADLCREIMSRLPAAGSPFLTPRESVNTVCYVLFVGNRGLCGNYNHALVRYAAGLLAEEEHEKLVVLVGRWGRDVIEAAGIPVTTVFDTFGDLPTAEDAALLSDYLKKLFLEGRADEVRLVYQHYRTALSQEPACTLLLPAEHRAQAAAGEEDYIFHPDPESVLRSAVELYIHAGVYAVLQEARTGEQAARMTAMTAATDATAELIDQLSLDLNRARQAAITTEISEIVGGANALRQNREEAEN